jgi:hypothetical protein
MNRQKQSKKFSNKISTTNENFSSEEKAKEEKKEN